MEDFSSTSQANKAALVGNDKIDDCQQNDNKQRRKDQSADHEFLEATRLKIALPILVALNADGSRQDAQDELGGALFFLLLL